MKVILNSTHLKKLLPFILCMQLIHVHAQYPNLVFNKLTIQEGLPDGSIRCLLQDKLGYIWMGTKAGIVRYNGYQTKVYNFGNANVKKASAETIFEDRSGRIWVGTFYMGLLYYDRATDDFKPYQPANGNKISNNYINQILDDGKQNLWVISVNLENNIYSLDKVNLVSGKIAHYNSFEKGNHHIEV